MLANLIALQSAMSHARLLSAAEAVAIDISLMAHGKFTLEQLMEIAGQSVATAATSAASTPVNTSRMLVLAGPGNNGGDALVASRWLKQFGHGQVDLLYPKPSRNPFFQSLVSTAVDSGVRLLSTIPPTDSVLSSYDAIIDGVFGFSFKPPVRAPYDELLALLLQCSEWEACSESERGRQGAPLPPSSGTSLPGLPTGWWLPQRDVSAQGGLPILWQRRRCVGVPIISIDIPSGWRADGESADTRPRDQAAAEPDREDHKERRIESAALAVDSQGDSATSGAGNTALRPDSFLRPSVIVHLTWPKAYAAQVDPQVQHWLGGRFMPPQLAEQYGLQELLKEAYRDTTEVAVRLV